MHVAADLAGGGDRHLPVDLRVAFEAAVDDDVLVSAQLADETRVRPDDRRRDGPRRPAAVAPGARSPADTCPCVLSVLPKMATQPPRGRLV